MASRVVLAVLFVVAGILHFVFSGAYVRIVPPLLPAPLALIYLSGAWEIAGGAGLLRKRTRVPAAWGLVVLLLAVWPANVYMATMHAHFPAIPAWILWTRVPLQLPMIWWAWLYTREQVNRGR